MGQKRKKHTDEFKAKVAIEAVKGIRSMGELSSVYGVHPICIGQWKRRLIERAHEVFNRSNGKDNAEESTASLYEEIGRLKVELDWFKKKL